MGAALERRTWVKTSKVITYPNLFTLLVGRPGVGKSHALKEAKTLAAAAGVATSPSDMTKQSLLDYLISEQVRKRLETPKGDSPFEEYHSLACYISEFGTLFRSNDNEMLSTMNDLWDCPDEYLETRRYRGKSQPAIPRPQLSILAGTATGYLSTVFPPEAWSQGFMARVILIHSSEAKNVPLFGEEDEETNIKEVKLKAALIRDLQEICQLRGEFKFTPEAKQAFQLWRDKGMAPEPSSPRLVSYNTRRIAHVQKLMMVASASRGNDLKITHDDLIMAMNWLLDAEQVMNDVFLEMAGRSDADIIRDLHHFAFSEYMRKSKAPIHIATLTHFLSSRTSSYQVPKIIDLAVKSHVFKRVAGEEDLYVPQPREAWGV